MNRTQLGRAVPWFGIAALAAVLVPAEAGAIPRFGIRQGAHCMMCHVDPVGGGMRNDYGRGVYATTELFPAGSTKLVEGALPLDARVTDTVALGSDVRVLYHFMKKPGATQPRANSFYIMEAALYAAADLWDVVSLYFAPAVHGSESIFFDASGILRFPFFDTYLKVGRFTPPYGYKFPNHTHFIRKQLGFNIRTKDVGVELGMFPGPLSIQLATFNGVPDRVDSDWDDNGAKGISGRISAMIDTRWVKAEVGASGFFNTGGNPAEEDPTGQDTRVQDLRVGAFGGLSIGRFAYLGEADYWRQDDRLADAPTGQLFSYQELAFLVTRGVDLVFSYELFDDDVSAAGNAVHRFGGGAQIFGFAFTELDLLFRYSVADERHAMSGLYEAMVVAHVFF